VKIIFLGIIAETMYRKLNFRNQEFRKEEVKTWVTGFTYPHPEIIQLVKEC
jgi:hypothetical protein